MAKKPSFKDAMARTITSASTAAKDRFKIGEAVMAAGGLGTVALDEGNQKSFGAETSAPSAAEERVKLLMSSGSKIREIDLEQLEENPFNARSFYDEKKVMDRAASLAKYKQLVPALVCPSDKNPGKYIVVDGHYRLKALKYNNAPAMLCVVDTAVQGDEALYRYSCELNEEREQQTALDNAFAWQRLIDRGVASNAEDLIAKGLVKAAKGTVSKTLSLLDLPKSVQDLIEQNPDKLGLHIAYEIFQLNKAAGADAALGLAQKVLEDDLSLRQTEEARKLIAAPKERKQREESRQYKIKVDGAMIGSLKIKDSGRVMLDVTLAEDDRDAFINELKNRFGLSSI